MIPDALRHTEHKKILYQETISSGAELLIDVLVLKNDGKRRIRARIMNLDKKEIANFVFRDDEAYWTLSHRIFNHDTDDRSRLTGSWLLAKLESLFCVLFEKNIIPKKPLHIDAGQKSVMAWVRKNEYDFASPEEQERYQRMHDHPEDFVFDVSVTVVPGITRHGYVIEKDKYTNELSALLKKPVTEETANELIYKTFFRVSFRKTPDQLRHERHTEPSVP